MPYPQQLDEKAEEEPLAVQTVLIPFESSHWDAQGTSSLEWILYPALLSWVRLEFQPIVYSAQKWDFGDTVDWVWWRGNMIHREMESEAVSIARKTRATREFSAGKEGVTNWSPA